MRIGLEITRCDQGDNDPGNNAGGLEELFATRVAGDVGLLEAEELFS